MFLNLSAIYLRRQIFVRAYKQSKRTDRTQFNLRLETPSIEHQRLVLLSVRCQISCGQLWLHPGGKAIHYSTSSHLIYSHGTSRKFSPPSLSLVTIHYILYTKLSLAVTRRRNADVRFVIYDSHSHEFQTKSQAAKVLPPGELFTSEERKTEKSVSSQSYRRSCRSDPEKSSLGRTFSPLNRLTASRKTSPRRKLTAGSRQKASEVFCLTVDR